MIRLFVTRNRISKLGLFKAVLGILIFLALVDYHQTDPGPFNLLSPIGGIQNILGLFGALLAGFIIEMFGYLGYSIPLIILFTGRKQETFNFRLLLPEILEVLSLVALVALLIPSEQGSGIQIVGLWGRLSSLQLIQFPGILFSLGALGAYQVVYFKENRLDLSFISLINLLVFLGYRFIRYLLKFINQNIDKSSKYYVVNWITPLGYFILRHFETLQEKIKKRIENMRLTFADVDVPSVINQSIKSLIFRKTKSNSLEDELTHEKNADIPVIDSELLMEKTFNKYKEMYFQQDQEAFWVHEEEIVI